MSTETANAPKRDSRATGPVADLYWEHGPEKFLELVCGVEGGIHGLQRLYGGGGNATWKRYMDEARDVTGLVVEFIEATQTYEARAAPLDPDAIGEQVREALDAIDGPPDELSDDQHQRAEQEMESKLSEEDDHDARVSLTDMGPHAHEEDLPREWRGGLQGGPAHHPGENAAPQALYDYYRARTEVWESIHEVRLKVAPGKTYAVIHPIGDIHIGDAECAFGKCERLVDWIGAHDGHYILGMGDYGEAATRGSVRAANIANQLLTHGESATVFALLMMRAAGSVICLGKGNHEKAVERDTGQPGIDPFEMCCEKLNVPAAGYDYPMIVYVGDQQYLLSIHHGAGSAATMGGIWNQVKRLLDNTSCDCAIMGHSHVKGALEHGQQGVVEDSEHGKTWDTKARYMVRSGTFKRYVAGSYGREKNLPPATTGTVAIRLYASHHDIHYRV